MLVSLPECRVTSVVLGITVQGKLRVKSQLWKPTSQNYACVLLTQQHFTKSFARLSRLRKVAICIWTTYCIVSVDDLNETSTLLYNNGHKNEAFRKR